MDREDLANRDERCTPEEIERFLRDASTEQYDAQPLDGLDAEEFFDPASVRWYRRAFGDRNPGRSQALSDPDFLTEWGFVVEHGDRLAPTRAAVLLFGRPRHLRRILHRPVVDCQFINAAFDSWTTDQRWTDRVVVEENLIQAWLMLSERYAKHAEHPFRLDPATLRRDDDPPDYVSFREAAINLLIHQDYGDHGRKASMRFFRDRTVFWNPGDAFATTDELLNSTEKDVRNPAIVAAFRRVGLSEQAGTGMRAIFRNWQSLGHVPPVVENDKAKKAFELCLLREELLSEDQRLFQAQLGVRLDEAQARLFAFACRQGSASLTDAKAVTGQTGPAARTVLDALVVQGLLRPLEEGVRYGIAEHLAGRFDTQASGRTSGDQVGGDTGELVTDQVPGVLGNMVTDQVRSGTGDMVTEQAVSRLTEQQRRIIAACDVPRSLAELMARAGVTHRTFFRRTHLQPLVDAGIVAMTNPANPRASDQRYVLTEAGVALKASRIGTGGEEEGRGQG